ncbi:MAG: hypothetical protein IPN17_32375 [Deltaproteobacteria bacterium]|nr:hypothetical protein [Deltaproteobacteria bacterium]MBK8696837.1 hypothetical protein [Deltaproteobacteria bacterium]MBP6830479.1 hypothetical protein [Deltaproteobacteria bacterium]
MAVSVALAGGFVGAQTPSPDAAVRRQFIERAIVARDAGDHRVALELFTQAAQIQMRPGLRMSIAQEQQALGLGRDACESATQCMTDVQADLASPESGRVTQGCAGLVASACVPFGRVRVVTATPVPTGLRVEVQGRPVDVASGTATVFVEPGDVLVRATVGAREAFAQDFSVERGLTASVSLDLTRAAEPVEVAPVVVAPVAVAPVATRVPVVTPHPLRAAAPVASSGGVTSRWWFWTGVGAVVLGGTLVGLAAGGLFDRLADPVGGTAYRVYAVTAQ